MAGQFEFHAFHHSFLRGIDKSMFLVVLKVTDDVNVRSFTIDLVYWLRFIASHKSSSCKRKPKVFIALNFWRNNTTPISNALRLEMVSITRQNVEPYQEILDIEENDIFEVEAINTRSLQVLKHKLGDSLKTLLSQQLKVPGLCEDAKEMCLMLKKKKKNNNKQIMQIVEVQHLGEKLLVKHQKNMKTTLSEADKNELIKFVFLFLHDLGEVVYFDFISKYAILDVEWFFRDVISMFIDPQKIAASQQQTTEEPHQLPVKVLRAARDQLLKNCGGEQAKVEYIFQCLYKMGVLLVMDDGWTGTWNSVQLPTKVIVPALSSMQRPYSPFGKEPGEQYKYWGRRLECKDVKFQLFPSAIFAMIQTKLHKECKNPSFDVGSGWVTFKEDRVIVYVRIGGDTDSWTDRQWVEIMLCAPEDASVKAEDLMKKMKDCIIDVCFGELEIGEEKVLKTKYVQKRMHEQHGTRIQGPQQLNSFKLVVPLSEIQREAEEKGLNYSHTWTHSEDDKLSELLLPSEQRKHIQKRTLGLVRVCEDYERFVKVVYDTPALDDPIPEIPRDFKNEDSEKLAGYIRDIAKQHQQQLGRVEANLAKLEKQMENMGRQVLQHSSKILQSLRVRCPCYPYLISEDNKFIKYIQLHHKVRIRYHCEYAEGSHPVHNAEGIAVALPKDWLKTWAPVLIPSLIVLFVGLKVGTTLLGVGSRVNDLVDVPMQEMIEFLKSNMGMESLDLHTWKQLKPTKEDVENVFRVVQQQFNARDNLDMESMMRKSFGLQWDIAAGAWLCQTHSEELR